MDRYIAPQLFIKYKQVVNTYLLYNGNITLIEISDILNGVSIAIIRSALKHYFQYPKLYKSKIIITNPKKENDIYYFQNHKEIIGCTDQDRVNKGIDTMNFWREVYFELQKLKKKHGNKYAQAHLPSQFTSAVNAVIKQRKEKEDNTNNKSDKRDNNN